MSLFISGLAFAGQQLLINEAKIGILLGSLISALAGYAIIRMSAKHPDDVRSPYID
jgi:NhaA family Na+:H+ antiporter